MWLHHDFNSALSCITKPASTGCLSRCPGFVPTPVGRELSVSTANRNYMGSFLKIDTCIWPLEILFIWFKGYCLGAEVFKRCAGQVKNCCPKGSRLSWPNFLPQRRLQFVWWDKEYVLLRESTLKKCITQVNCKSTSFFRVFYLLRKKVFIHKYLLKYCCESFTVIVGSEGMKAKLESNLTAWNLEKFRDSWTANRVEEFGKEMCRRQAWKDWWSWMWGREVAFPGTKKKIWESVIRPLRNYSLSWDTQCTMLVFYKLCTNNTTNKNKPNNRP